MGIPSYFSYIVKNHRNVISKFQKINKTVNNLYLDSNSIVYDCMRSIEYGSNFENKLLLCVCQKIEEYIETIKPNDTVYITFDGVAPVAKLEQQRNRRFKSYLENEIFTKCELKSNKKVWNKTNITPGTVFMTNLNIFIKKYFYQYEMTHSMKYVIVSGSDEEGEGEHKIFEFIRKLKDKHYSQTTVIYGLDADLIMLCLNHVDICKNIYLYRETPEFIKSIDSSLDPNSSYVLNIYELSNHVINRLSQKKRKQRKFYIYDYILLCFFLGNDFMPHFPALNIRTTGIDTLLNAYLNTIGKTDKNLTDGKKINWDQLKILIEYLAEKEETLIKDEYKRREKMERRYFGSDTPEKKMQKYLNIPIKNREVEKEIDPYNYDWESRYYKCLFKVDVNNEWRRKICMNYIEGLEWTMKYYTSGCIDWKWTYKYNYPPLLSDLKKYIPSWDVDMLEVKDCDPITNQMQLAYVLPVAYHDLLKKETVDKIKHLDCFNQCGYEMEWAFCKYIWEAHINLPHIDLKTLEELLI